MSRPRAYQLIDASAAVENVYNCRQNEPVKLYRETDKAIPEPIPQTESQARPLTRIKDPEQQREAWQEAVETAPDGKVTANHIEAVVIRKMNEPPKPPKIEKLPVEDAVVYVNMAIRQFERIQKDDPSAKKELRRAIIWINERIKYHE